jgi:hypothetical protein
VRAAGWRFGRPRKGDRAARNQRPHRRSGFGVAGVAGGPRVLSKSVKRPDPPWGRYERYGSLGNLDGDPRAAHRGWTGAMQVLVGGMGKTFP